MRYSLVLSMMGGMAFCMAAGAVTPGSGEDSYQRIVERNVFNLKTPEAVKEESPASPPPKLFLTGITTIHGDKRALLQGEAHGSRPGAPAKTESWMLREGQRDGNIEVLQIDEKNGIVKVNDFGSVVTLTFEKNGLKPPPAPPQAPPTLPQVPGMLPTPRSVNPTMRPLPTRGGYSAPTAVSYPPTPTGMASQPAPATFPGTPTATAEQNQLTADEQRLLMELQQAQAQSRDNQTYPPSLPAAPSPTATQPARPPGAFPALMSQ